MSIKIQEGKYYRRRDGLPVGPAAPTGESMYRWKLDGRTYCDDGTYDRTRIGHSYDLITEVIVIPSLPFQLRVGSKYNTSDWGVVELRDSGPFSLGLKACAPFRVMQSDEARFYVNPSGEIISEAKGTVVARIISEYVEPTPPTIAERLEKAIELLANPRKDDSAFALIRGCVAELKAKEVARG
jgi:hypothetical protein